MQCRMVSMLDDYLSGRCVMSRTASLMTHSSLPSMGGTAGVPPVAIRMYLDCSYNMPATIRMYLTAVTTCLLLSGYTWAAIATCLLLLGCTWTAFTTRLLLSGWTKTCNRVKHVVLRAYLHGMHSAAGYEGRYKCREVTMVNGEHEANASSSCL